MSYSCIGLMSGTSLDGIDAVLVDVESDGTYVRFRHGITRPFPDSFRRHLSFLAKTEMIRKELLARTDVLMGHLLADAVINLLDDARIQADDVLLVASHGQTIGHYPDKKEQFGYTVASSLQIGDGDVIAARTGISTVSDFRRRDMAVGGEGAPLIPLLDRILFQNPGENRCCLNIGGIANVTLLPADGSEPIAFDTGPGNCLSDLAVARFVGGGRRFDNNGELAFRGKIHKKILDRAMSDRYFQKLPPKSTGREYFNEEFLSFMLGMDRDVPFEDVITTVSALTPGSVADALKRFVPPEYFPGELIVSGGGVYNQFFMETLRRYLPNVRVVSSGVYGISPDFKEAIGFALMGYRTLIGLPSSIPSVTGAGSSQILGKVSLTKGLSRFFEPGKGRGKSD